ncbi:MAG: archease [Deltaproteobacteria bacterium]|nr:archease [Deltaproteobacteria bacterium]
MNKPPANDTPFYRELEHTGDIGIEVTAPTRAELFRRAALALAVLLVEPSNVECAELRTVEITARDDIDLMHDLLTELLQLFAADGFIWRDATVKEQGRMLHVMLQGESFDPSRHTSRGEIKAVTYHQLTVENVSNEWRTCIIFDV